MFMEMLKTFGMVGFIVAVYAMIKSYTKKNDKK